MADPNMTKNSSDNANQTMQREQAKAEVGGGDRQREHGGMDKNAQEKSAIGGQPKGEEMGQDKSREFDKSRSSEPTGQR